MLTYGFFQFIWQFTSVLLTLVQNLLFIYDMKYPVGDTF